LRRAPRVGMPLKTFMQLNGAQWDEIDLVTKTIGTKSAVLSLLYGERCYGAKRGHTSVSRGSL